MKIASSVASLGLILLILSFPSQVLSQETDLSEYEKRLNQLAAQISDLEDKIQKAKRKESSVLSRLGKLGLEKKVIKNQIDVYNTQQARANAELNDLQKKIPQLEEQLEKEQNSIAEILVTIYKFGKFNYFELMLQADNVSNLLAENKNLAQLAEHQQRIIADYLKKLDELNTAKESLETKKAEISQLKRQAQDKQLELVAQEQKSRALISEINQNITTHQKLITEKSERVEQLQNLMARLREEEISLSFPLIPMDERKGQLEWPLQGQIVTQFGLIRNPKFNTSIRSNGIEISPRDNMVVKAIHPGIVAYADYFEGYGYLVIIDHGLRYYTLYGHCAENLIVKKGDAVRGGDPIAYVGDIGSLKGATLYFEISHKREPQNPLQWLKRR